MFPTKECHHPFEWKFSVARPRTDTTNSAVSDTSRRSSTSAEEFVPDHMFRADSARRVRQDVVGNSGHMTIAQQAKF